MKSLFQKWLWLPLAMIPMAKGDTPQNGPAEFKTMTLEELSQIDVTTPSKEPEKAFQTPAAIFVITGEDIKRSGATSIPEALRLAPGVEVARIDSNKWSIGIRGFGSRLSRSVLVLIDGRTVYTTLFDGTYWEVQDTFMDDIDRIEVIRGPGGTIWGPNAVNGVINVITKNSKDTKGMLANAGGGNYEQGFAGYRYGGGNGDDFSWRAYVKGFTRAPEEHPDGRNFDDWRAWQTGFRMDWAEPNKSAYTLQGDLYMEKAGESVQATSYTAPYSQIVDANEALSGGDIMGRWQKTLASGSDIQLQIYYDRTNRWEPNVADIRNTFDVDFLQRFRLPGRQEISWGLGARAAHAHNPVVVSGLTFVPAVRTDQLYSAFLQDQIALIDNRLSFIAGTKLLHTNFTEFAAEPSGRLLWTPSDKQTIWAAYTHAVRTPSDVEENFYLLGFVGIAPNGIPELARFNANPNFAPEQMNGYELGYRKLIGQKISIAISSFYNHYHDLLDEEITGGFFLEDDPPPVHYLLPAQFRNGLLGYTKGVEVAPEWRPKSFWRLRGSYSFLHMNLGKSPNSGDIGTAPGIVGSSPQHEAWIQSSFDISKVIQLDLTYRYVSPLPGQMVPAYSTGDARFAWLFRRGWELALVGQNLLQPYHAEFGGGSGATGRDQEKRLCQTDMEQVNHIRLAVFSHAGVLACLLAGFAGYSAGQAVDPALEYQVKAAFLLNFTKFVDWPAGAFAGSDSPITICILGNDPFGRILDEIVQGESVSGRKVGVRRISEVAAPPACQVVYIGSAEKDASKIVASTGRGVLTVGEGERFLRDGGMIAFVIDNRRVRFDIDQAAAASAGLNLSSRLLSVARVVGR